MKWLAVFTFILASVLVGSAQSAGSNCPNISVTGPPGEVLPDDENVFKVTIDGWDEVAKPLQFVWTISSGTIVRGQATKEIAVNGVPRGLTLTATVDIKGLPVNCLAFNSESAASIIDFSPTKADEYTELKFAEEKRRLNAYFDEIKTDPTSRGQVLFYATTEKEIAKRIEKVKKIVRAYELKNPHFTDRITFVNGGRNPESDSSKTTLWLVPAGATPPTP